MKRKKGNAGYKAKKKGYQRADEQRALEAPPMGKPSRETSIDATPSRRRRFREAVQRADELALLIPQAKRERPAEVAELERELEEIKRRLADFRRGRFVA